MTRCHQPHDHVAKQPGAQALAFVRDNVIIADLGDREDCGGAGRIGLPGEATEPVGLFHRSAGEFLDRVLGAE